MIETNVDNEHKNEINNRNEKLSHLNEKKMWPTTWNQKKKIKN